MYIENTFTSPRVYSIKDIGGFINIWFLRIFEKGGELMSANFLKGKYLSLGFLV